MNLRLGTESTANLNKSYFFLKKKCVKVKTFDLQISAVKKNEVNGFTLPAEQEAFVFPSSVKKTPSKKYCSQARVSLCVDPH